MITPLHTTSNILYCMFLLGSTWAERMVDTLTSMSTIMPCPLQLEAAANNNSSSLSDPDMFKTDSISILTDKLYTPLTSIHAAAEILCDNPNLDATQRQQFLSIILHESEKLAQVVSQTLTLMESGDKSPGVKSF